MIKINGTLIIETHDEYGVMSADGEEDWDLEDEESARVIAWAWTGSTLIKRKVYFGETEVAE